MLGWVAHKLKLRAFCVHFKMHVRDPVAATFWFFCCTNVAICYNYCILWLRFSRFRIFRLGAVPAQEKCEIVENALARFKKDNKWQRFCNKKINFSNFRAREALMLDVRCLPASTWLFFDFVKSNWFWWSFLSWKRISPFLPTLRTDGTTSK